MHKAQEGRQGVPVSKSPSKFLRIRIWGIPFIWELLINEVMSLCSPAQSPVIGESLPHLSHPGQRELIAEGSSSMNIVLGAITLVLWPPRSTGEKSILCGIQYLVGVICWEEKSRTKYLELTWVPLNICLNFTNIFIPLVFFFQAFSQYIHALLCVRD